MSAAEILEQIRQLPPAERDEVVARVREEFDRFDDELSPAEIEIINQRLKEHRDNPDDVIPWEEVKARLEARYGK